MEGMRVAIAQTLHVTETYRLGSFGEVVLSAIGPQDQPNQVAAADSAAADEVRALNTASRIVLDDGEEENESYPNETWNPATTPYLQNGGTLRSGDAITGLAGVLHYAFDQYEIQPVNVADPLHPADAITFTGFTTRPALPDVGSGFTVASFNVLNYFTTLGSRGAETADEFERQADKIVSAIVELDADVVGLIEIENNGTAIADLVGRLNAAAGATRVYDYIDTGVIGSDEIAVGFIYDTLTTTPDGAFALLDSTVSPAFLDEKNRPALAQTFQETATGGSVTVAINHLKSKGSDCDDTANPGDPAYGVAPYAADPDTGGYAGNCNLTRTAAAQVLGQWMDDDPTGTGADAALILGDLNSYANEDPITALEGLGWTDLIEAYVGNSFAEGGYSYVYDGEHGTLDYGLANDEASGAVTGAAAWHINSVEPPALDYNDYNPAANYSDDEFRSSDHDPVLVGLDLRTTPADLKRDAQADLTDILGLGGVVDDRRITRAIADIEASLAPELWTSERTLDKDTGKRVFAAERRAVRRLLWTSPAIDAEVTAVIEKLLEADRLLATIALEESNASAWDQSRAEKWIRCGDKAAAEGDYFRAVALYMKAWIKATNEVF
jgi:predicted extracellular nuclease